MPPIGSATAATLPRANHCENRCRRIGEAARTATLGGTYRRLVARRGVKKAIIAIAHRLVTAIYYILLHHEPYRAPSPSIVDERRKAVLVQRMQRRIEQLGFAVTLQPVAALAA